MRARMALLVDGIRQSTGLGRGTRSKILPILMVLVSVVPAAIILVIAAITGPIIGRPVALGDYYPIISVLLLILTGILAPGLLIPDRQNNVLSLYLVRPIGMFDYLAARWLAFFLVTTVIVLIGPLTLALGYTLLSPDAVTEFRENWQDFPKVILAAAVIAALLTSIPMGIAAITPRRAYAAATVIGGALLLSAAVGILTETFDTTTNIYERPITEEEVREAEQFLARFEEPGLPPDAEVQFGVDFPSGESRNYRMSEDEVARALQGGNVRVVEFENTSLLDRDTARWVVFADPTGTFVFVTDLLFEDVDMNTYRELVAEHPDYYPVGAYMAWVIFPLLLMWWRYWRYTA